MKPAKAEDSKKTSARSNKQPPKSASKSGQSLSFLALLIALAALVLSGYIGWRALPVEQAQPALITGQEQQQTQIARVQARLTEINRELTPIKSGLTEQESRSERLLNRTDSLSKTIQEVAGSTQEGWKLAEVEYLLRLANQRLLMTSDTKAAKALLKSADQLLLELDNYNLFPVREALAEDIASLNSLPDFDQEGLYLRLEALTRQVYQLPLMEREAIQETSEVQSGDSSTPAVTTDNSNWKTIAVSMLKNTWESFVGLFRFTPHREQSITSLLSPEENILIRQNLQLMLEQVKLSVLSRDQAIYNTSLKQAENWIQQYFSLSGPQATAMLEELKDLEKITVKPVTTNISRALELLKSRQLTEALDSEKASVQPIVEPSQTVQEEAPQQNEENSQSAKQPQKNNESTEKQESSPEPLNNQSEPQGQSQPAPAGNPEEEPQA